MAGLDTGVVCEGVWRRIDEVRLTLRDLRRVIIDLLDLSDRICRLRLAVDTPDHPPGGRWGRRLWWWWHSVRRRWRRWHWHRRWWWCGADASDGGVAGMGGAGGARAAVCGFGGAKLRVAGSCSRAVMLVPRFLSAWIFLYQLRWTG